MGDLIDRKAAIDALDGLCDIVCQYSKKQRSVMCGACPLGSAFDTIEELPSAQPKQTDCEYCHEDSDGYVRSIEKNSHAWLVRRGRTMKLRVGFKGVYSECDISFCPMCGRRLKYG